MPPTRTPTANSGRIYLSNSTRKHRLDERRLRRTALTILEAAGERGSTLTVALVGDTAIRRLNKTHRGKDTPTDVLSFSLVEPGPTIAAPPAQSEVQLPPAPPRAPRAGRGAAARGANGGHAAPFLTKGRAAPFLTKGHAAPFLTKGHPAPFLTERMLGDVVISLDAARRQADGYGVPLIREVERLLIHGVLHVLGHDHEHPAERARMARAERRLARAIGMPWPEGYRSGR